MRATSLTSRIALLVLVIAAAVFALTGYALDRALAQQLAERDDLELLGKVEQARHVIRERSSLEQLLADPHVLRDVVVGYEHLGMVVRDAGGSEVLAAGAALPGVAAAPARQAARPAGPGGIERRVVRQDSTAWLMMAAQAPFASDRVRPVTVVLGRSSHSAQEFQTAYRKRLALAVALAALGTAALGWLAVWHGLRPLAAVARAARRITVNRLGERITLASQVREVQDLSAALNVMSDRLQESFVRLSRFSADLAHDLKTPLTSLILQNQIALSKARTRPEYEAVLASNLEELERLSRMVDSMLFVARAENAQIAMSVQPIGLAEELQRLAEDFEPLASEAGVRFRVSAQATVLADPMLLRRALTNLVINAVNHAQPGSEIELAAWQDSAGTSLRVSNRGTPIAPQHLPHLFDRFYRADASRSASAGSAGLGLAIVKSIMDLHGAQAAVESAQDGWTRFTLVFPPAEESGPPGEARTQLGSGHLPGRQPAPSA